MNSNRDKLDMIANELLLRETIEGEDVYKIVRGEFTPTTKEDIERAAAEKAASALAAEEEKMAEYLPLQNRRRRKLLRAFLWRHSLF